MITGTLFISNTATRGGAVANLDGGSTVITASTFTNNQHGAIQNIAGSLSVSGSAFISNTNSGSDGGAIANGGSVQVETGGAVTVTHTSFTDNTAFDGGAIANRNGGVLLLDKSAVTHNHSDLAGGGLLNEQGVLSVRESTIGNNSAGSQNFGGRGGGIANQRGGAVTVTQSTVSGNQATESGQCGGIANDGVNSTGAVSLIMENSTISGNRADAYGGGLCSLTGLAAITVTHSTLVFNHAGDLNKGGGIYIFGGAVTLGSTILAGNDAGSDASPNNLVQDTRSPGGVTSLGFNLSDTAPTGFGVKDLINRVPLVGALAANGGPTETHALLAGSPAIDAGSNDQCPPTDQRGVTRPRDGNGDQAAICDIGAYEVETPLIVQGMQVYLPLVSR